MTLQDCIDRYESRQAAGHSQAVLTSKGSAVVALRQLCLQLAALDGQDLNDVLDMAAEHLRPALERAGYWPATA